MNNDELIFPQDKTLRADAQRNRQRLLETAKRLFTEQSVADVTMSAVAREAHVGKGTLYRHFNDKADLCLALLDEAMRGFQERTLAHIRESDSPLASLRWFLGAALGYVTDHMPLLLEVANQGGLATLHHPAHLWWRQTIRGLLAQLQPPGDVDFIADVLYVMLDVQTIRYQQRTQGYDLARIEDGLLMTLTRLIVVTLNQPARDDADEGEEA